MGEAEAAGLFTEAGPEWREIPGVGNVGKKDTHRELGLCRGIFLF